MIAVRLVLPLRPVRARPAALRGLVPRPAALRVPGLQLLAQPDLPEVSELEQAGAFPEGRRLADVHAVSVTADLAKPAHLLGRWRREQVVGRGVGGHGILVSFHPGYPQG